MNKGRNPSPPEEFDDFDFRSSRNNRVLFLKPTCGMPYKELPSIDYFREALMRCKLVTRALNKKNSEAKPISMSPEVGNGIKEKTFEGFGENSMDQLLSTQAKSGEASAIPIMLSRSRPETIKSDSKRKKEKEAQKLKSDMSQAEVFRVEDFSKALSKYDSKRKKEKEAQKLKSDMSLAEVFRVEDFSKALSKDLEFRNKLQDKREEFLGPESPKRFHRRNHEVALPSGDLRNKINERKEDSSEYKRHKTLHRKKEEDMRDYECLRYLSRSSRSRHGGYSSDESEFSHRSHRSHKRSKSKDSVVSRKRSDHKSSRRHSDSGDSDGSVKIISSNPRREAPSKTKTKNDDLDKELPAKKAQSIEKMEKPKKKEESTHQLKPSQKSVQRKPVVVEDSYLDDVELAAGVFGGSETFYCKVCQLNLNGISCYETHMNGKKHKKALNAQLLRPEALLYEVIGNNKKDPSFMQALNRNVRMTKCNEKSELQSMANRYHDNPLPGLNYIDEIHAKDGINYYCELCEAPCMPASIFSHLLGFKHYMNYLNIIEPSYYERNKDRPKREIEREVLRKLREHERKFGRKEVTVLKCEVDARGFPNNDFGNSHRMSHREEDFSITPSAIVDDYGDFYCKICDAHMNNESMFHAHMVGKRHLKNEKKFSAGLGPSLSSSGKVRAPPNTPSVLEEMLFDIDDTPIVGLNFMRETQNPNGEYYTCFICGCCATSDVIDHIISMKHRIKYLETVNENRSIPNNIGSIRELEVSTLARENLVSQECRDIEARYGRGRVEVYI